MFAEDPSKARVGGWTEKQDNWRTVSYGCSQKLCCSIKTAQLVLLEISQVPNNQRAFW